MRPSQSDIILNYLEKGVEIFATFECKDPTDIWGCVNCRRKDGLYYCLIREIRSDNQMDYFEEDFFDKNQEMKFEKIEDLIEHIKYETGLSLNHFAKAKNDIHY